MKANLSEFSSGELLPETEVVEALRSCGRHPRIYRSCRIVPANRVSLGSSVQIDEGVRIYAGQGVEIGDYVHIAFTASISGGGRCRIGSFASVGASVRILTGTDTPADGRLNNPTVPESYRSVERGETELGEFSVVYTNSVVFPGVVIGAGAVVSAGGIVHRSLKPWTVYAGNPLVAVGKRDEMSIRTIAERLRNEESSGETV